MTVIERIDEARKRWNLLEHPFYQRWERGELSREDLAFYAGEYRHAVVALAGAAAATGDAEHAREEAAHVALWDEFAAALDAPLDREPNAETRSCAAACHRDDALEPRAVLYAVESAQPPISSTKLTGLVEHYGVAAGSQAPTTSSSTPGETTTTQRHRKQSWNRQPRRRQSASSNRRRALKAYWHLLDRVEAQK